jgi:hypothetical protein
MLSGSMTWFINLEQFTNVAMLVPVALLATEKLIRTQNNRHTALTGIVLALVLLAGQPETALYLFFMLACYICFRLVKIRKDGASVNITFLRLFISGMIGFGLSAPLWLSFIEFMQLSHHIHPIGGKMGIGSAPFINAAAIITPSFFDLPIAFPTGPENGRWDLLGGYCGFLAFHLSILGILFRSRHNGYALLFGLFGLFILLKNFGFPIVTWFGYLPLFDQVWTPRWAGPTWTFSFSVTGAIGLEIAKNWFSEPHKKVEASFVITRMVSSLKERIGFDRVTAKKISVLIILSLFGLLLTGNSFGQAYRYWKEVSRSIEQLDATDTAKKQFKRLLSADTLVIEIIGPLDAGKAEEAFKRINTMKRKMRTLWTAFCLQIILLFALLLWFRHAKGSNQTRFIGSPKTTFYVVTVTSCLCLAVLYFLNFIDLSLFLSALTKEEGKFFVSSALGGLFVTFSIMATITLLVLLFRGKKNATHALVALGIVELWFFIPRGYDVYYLYWKVVPFVAGIIGVFALARNKKYWAASAFFFMVATYTWIDIQSSRGLPERCNPFNQPPYVDFIRKDNDFSRIMALGGTLMPNFSSALQLQDIRYINALSLGDYHRHMSHILSFYSRSQRMPSSLWFTGIPRSEDNGLSRMLAQMWANLPYCWLLGVKHILTPNSTHLNMLPLVYQGEVNIYEMPFFLPRAFIAHRVEYANSPEQATERVRELGSAMVNKLILEKEIPARYTHLRTNRDPDAYASIQEYDFNQVIIETHSQRPGILVLTDVFYPGWKAYVDGKPTEVFRVDGLVRGVLLDKGSHTVMFRYLPDIFVAGLIIAAIAFVSSLVLLFLPTRNVDIVPYP